MSNRSDVVRLSLSLSSSRLVRLCSSSLNENGIGRKVYMYDNRGAKAWKEEVKALLSILAQSVRELLLYQCSTLAETTVQ